MKKWKQIVAAFILIAGVGVATLPASNVSAINVFTGCKANAGSAVCKASGTDSASSLVKNIINTLLVVLGMIAVVMIVIGGIRYTTSNGEASQIKSAKDTILYSVVGLVVAIMSFGIVNFVIGKF
jgi:cytochrome bd-type quinol oxidase subunit 2